MSTSMVAGVTERATSASASALAAKDGDVQSVAQVSVECGGNLELQPKTEPAIERCGFVGERPAHLDEYVKIVRYAIHRFSFLSEPTMPLSLVRWKPMQADWRISDIAAPERTSSARWRSAGAVLRASA